MSLDMKSAGLDEQDNVIQIASKNTIFCRDSDTIKSVVEKIVSSGHRRVPIMSKHGIVGIVTKSDILDAFLRREDFDQKISDIMTRDPITCSKTESIGHALQKFKLSRRGGFPVIDKKDLVGMVSERDIVKHLAEVETGMMIKDIMTRKPFIVQPNISVYDCMKIMVNTKYRRLPVVDSGSVIGIVTAEDLLTYVHSKDYNLADLDEPLEKIVRSEVVTINEDADISEAVSIMEKNGIGGVVVVSGDNKLEGIVTERDIMKSIRR